MYSLNGDILRGAHGLSNIRLHVMFYYPGGLVEALLSRGWLRNRCKHTDGEGIEPPFFAAQETCGAQL